MAYYEDRDKVQIETEPEDSDIVEEDGEVATCMVHINCYAIKRIPTLHKGIRFSQGVW